MSDGINLELDLRDFLRGMKLAERQFDHALARALSRTAFEIRDAERREAESIFDLTPRGAKFLAGPTAYRVKPARPGELVAEVAARPATAGILAKHVQGATLTAASGDTLKAGGKVAIPVEGLRGASGRIPARLTPVKLLAPGGAGFIRGGALLARVGRKGAKRLRMVLSLTPRAKIPARFDFHRVAAETARRVFPAKVREELAKVRGPK